MTSTPQQISESTSVPTIPIAPLGQRHRISRAQRGLWFLSELNDGSAAAYHLAVGLELHGALDVPALRDALHGLLERHEALRSRLTRVDGEAFCHYPAAAESSFELALHDGTDQVDAEPQIARLVQEEAVTPFDLALGPLIRGRLIQGGELRHILLLTLHHLVADGWSMLLLLRELAELYNSRRLQRPAGLAALPLQFADFAAWQADSDLDADLQFWRHTLAGAPDRLELPTDHPRPSRIDHAGGFLCCQFDAGLTASLKAVARRHESSLFVLMLASWALLLSRLSGQDDVVIGVAVANRPRAETHGLIGFFVNTLPVRIQLDGEPDLAQLLQRVRAALQAARMHADPAFDQIVEAVRPIRDPGHHPLFQSAFSWPLPPHDVPEFDGLRVRPLQQVMQRYGLPVREPHSGAAAMTQAEFALAAFAGTAESGLSKFELSPTCWEVNGEIHGGLEFASRLFERTTVLRWLDHWRMLLQAMAEGDSRPCVRWPLLRPDQQRQLLEQYSSGPMAAVPTRFFHELLERQAELRPTAIALRQQEISLDYRALNARANHLARQLHDFGIGGHDRVAIYAERRVETVIAILAVLKAGAAYVPLDPGHPDARLLLITTDSAPKALLIASGSTCPWTGESGPVMEIEFDPACSAPAADNLSRAQTGLTPQHAAYLIYTSGSTGRPKGVVVEHASLSNFLLEQELSIAIGIGDCVLQISSFGFDLSVFELGLALARGALLQLAPRDCRLVGEALSEALSKNAITHAILTPSALGTLDPGQSPSSLRWLAVGGEALSRRLAIAWSRPGRQLIHAYGPTETTVMSSACEWTAELADEPPIGRPMVNTCIYVLDRSGALQPLGVAGELFIGGAAVARGYLDLPELNAERFVPDPFTGPESARMYRSGDLGRWRGDGMLEFLGRTDQQVKLRGFRIELGEIEARLLEQPAVRAAAVIVQPDAAGEPRLLAYVVGPSITDLPAVREQLARTLPEYMLPAAMLPLPALPLTVSGKLDRAALPVPDRAACSAVGFEAPQGLIEIQLAAVWQALLGLPAVGRHDHFFQLGGHSLLAVQLISRLRKQLNIEISLGAVFEHPRLSALAQQLAAATSQTLPGLLPVVREPDMQVSFAQQRLWFLAQLGAAASRAYTMSMCVELQGTLDHAALRGALDRIVRRHEALRTTFVAVDGEPRQRIAAPDCSHFHLDEHDLSQLATPEAERDRLITIATNAAFDLQQGPLIRGLLLRTGASTHALLITQHHIVSDGWSLGVLLDELNTGYRQLVEGIKDTQPAPQLQYVDFACWQRQWVSGAVLDRQAAWWGEVLADAPLLSTLPADRPRAAVQDFAGGFVELTLEPALTRGLRELSERHGSTLFMTLLAGWAVLMARMSGQTDLVIGSPSANRGHRDLEGMIGFFVNTLALRVDLSGAPTVSSLLAQVRQRALDALDHQDIPFEQVVDLVRPQRSLAFSPLVQVVLAWQNAPRTQWQLPGLKVQTLRGAEHVSAVFDLAVHLWDEGDTLSGGVEFASALFERSSVERWLRHWKLLLGAMVADPLRAIAELPVLDADERQALIGGRNQTAVELPPGLSVVKRIAQHAREHGAQIAARQEDQTLSYAELEAWAGRLATRLQGYGVGPGDLVAVCLPRRISMLVGLLAVFKTGAAYVPMDLAHPAGRLLLMLGDCAPKLVLGEAELAGMLAGLTHTPWIIDPELDRFGVAAPSPLNTPPAGASDLAYVIYTSGSTGQPKGVLIEHDSLVNLLDWHQREFALGPGDGCSCVAGVGFDACALEIWSAWWNGATVVLPPQSCAGDPARLLAWWQHEPLAHSFLPTALAELAFKQDTLNRHLRALLVGGDALRSLPRPPIQFVLHNIYGPTECTVMVSTGRLQPGDIIHVGQPIANTRIYVLDQFQQPVPIGASGEIYLGGSGVARGYLKLPQLTAERFLSDPFVAGGRMYRSGDLGRWRSDGMLEILGRNDQQVKIRGYRIELGEIEACIAAHPAVQEAAVLAHTGPDSDKCLIAWLAPRRDQVPDSLADDQVAHWQTLYEDTYTQSQALDTLDDFVGWNSSYDGQAIPLEQMQEWQEGVLERIRALRPRRVLEIGCGSGLLLLKLAPDCERYLATDFSARTLATLRAKLARLGLSQVELQQRVATDFDGLAEGSFDTIVINSVIQYFPDAAYLDRVVAGALRLLVADGALFIGDVRNRMLLDAFHASIQLHRADDADPSSQLVTRLQRDLNAERELLVAPEFFLRLADADGSIRHVRVLPKQGRHDNELNAFRYDVVLHRGELPVNWPAQQLDWHAAALTSDSLAEFLQTTQAGSLLLLNIGNPRVAAAALAAALLTGRSESAPANAGAIRQLQRASLSESMLDPHTLLHLAASCGFVVELSWAGSDRQGRYHALLVRQSTPAVFALPAEWLPGAGHGTELALSNAPLEEAQHARLIEQVRQALKEQLPDYMIPARFIVLERLPLSANGKIDRRALPLPDLSRHQGDFVAPRTPLEHTVAKIWAEALRLDRVGAYDHFFELGGHSLLAVQVISRLRQALHVEVSLSTLFSHPVLTGFVQSLAHSTESEMPPITAVDRAQPLPLSFAQQRLWFLDQLGSAVSQAYHIPLAWQLHGPLDLAALRHAVRSLVARHEVLRTHFVVRAGVPVQHIVAAAEFDLALEPQVLSAAADEAQTELTKLLAEEAQAPFDLQRGPLLRVRLVRIDDPQIQHVLLITLHHILADGWSVGLLQKELSHAYRAFQQGQSAPLPDLPMQYADYAVWQRRWVADSVLQGQADYWQASLAGAPALLELPTDRPRPATQDYQGEVLEFTFDDALSHDLRALCQRHGCTPYMALLAGWALLLSRLSGQSEVVIGSPTANRGQREIEGLIGFFVNMLALRLDVTAELNVSEFLAQVKAQVLAGLQHQDIPFEQVVELLKPPRSLSHAPVFQVVLAWQNAPGGDLDLGGVSVRPLVMPVNKAKFDLLITLGEVGDRIEGMIGFARALFDRRSIERHLQQWQTLLKDMCRNEQQHISRLSLLDGQTRAVLLGPWAAGDQHVVGPDFFHEQFEKHARDTPDAAAIFQQDQRLSYGDLNARANRLARQLRSLGAGPESRIALSLPRGPELIMSVLAIMKAGASYVPLDPAYPTDRLAYMLQDCQPLLLLRAGGPGLGWAGDCAQLVIEATDWDHRSSWSAQDLDRQENRLAPEHLAYLIYTSGSTGRPKGTLIEHRALSNFVAATRQMLNIQPTDRVAQFTSVSFDVFVFELVLALGHGAALCLPAKGALVAGPVISATIARHQISHVFLTPAALGSLHRPEDLAGVRTLIVGGEAVPQALVSFWARARTLINGYGPTEATVFATWHRCQAEHPADPPIGRPLANIRTYVLDPYGEPVPPGVTGELVIGGAGVARGYWNQPELTAERFLDDPFSPVAGARMYRSGDLVRWCDSGDLEFVGRNDFQVKLRGLRIELGEIETRMRELPGVREAVVLLREDVPGERQLVGYWVPSPISAERVELLAPSALRAHLLAGLPEFMVPAAFVQLDRLPTGGSGKLARNALPIPGTAAYAQQAFEKPEGEIEGLLATIWSELLHLDGELGRHDNFFQLGGHSLLVLQVAWRLKQAGLPVAVADLFRHPTIESLAAFIASADVDAHSQQAVELRSGPLPALFLFHDGSGQLVYAHLLADALPQDRAIFGLPPATEQPESQVTVEQMAERLERLIREIQATGPYLLAGWSFGGLLAHAVATRLLGAGEQVAYLGLLDSFLELATLPDRAADDVEKSHLLAILQMQAMGNPELQEALEILKQDAGDLDFMQLTERCRALQRDLMPAHLAELPTDELQTYLARQHAWQIAASHYHARPIDLPVHLFRADNRHLIGRSSSPWLGWECVLRPDSIQLIEVAGDHYSMLQAPNLQNLVQAFAASLPAMQ